MKERPILFSGPMVRAILEGRKTQTRRVAGHGIPVTEIDGSMTMSFGAGPRKRCPYVAGMRLWVRETWLANHRYDQTRPRDIPNGEEIWMKADGPPPWGGVYGRLRPSIFMLPWMSRLSLDVTGVRVERLQDISEDDAKAEGVEPDVIARTCCNMPYDEGDGEPVCCGHPDEELDSRAPFSVLWDSINGKRPGCSWGANPWVWAIEFRKDVT